MTKRTRPTIPILCNGLIHNIEALIKVLVVNVSRECILNFLLIRPCEACCTTKYFCHIRDWIDLYNFESAGRRVLDVG